ncbi:hypothetical protein ACGFNP_25395 [Nonomuraea sp. NPDC049269]|uniref:hypothetical protein n=1 Tax=Nonomuraea sp. NPDC049269 TaxID=3364349 RepID=UPI003714F166
MTPAELIETALREQMRVCAGVPMSGSEAEDAARIAVDALAGAGKVVVPAAYIPVALTSPVELTSAQDLRDHIHARDELLAAARAVLARGGCP